MPVSPWHHSIDLGDGVVTPGSKTPHHIWDELRRLRLPEMAGKSVLDIGAWDGYYTFHAEHFGASRVVALDHYAWSIDFPKAAAYRARQLAGGQPIRAFHTVPELWDPVGLPGKRGFDLAYPVAEQPRGRGRGRLHDHGSAAARGVRRRAVSRRDLPPRGTAARAAFRGGGAGPIPLNAYL